MMFGPVPLFGLGGLARSVANDIATAGAAEHRSGRSLAGVLAMGESHLTAALAAATPRLGLGRSLAGHDRKRTTTDPMSPDETEPWPR